MALEELTNMGQSLLDWISGNSEAVLAYMPLGWTPKADNKKSFQQKIDVDETISRRANVLMAEGKLTPSRLKKLGTQANGVIKYDTNAVNSAYLHLFNRDWGTWSEKIERAQFYVAESGMRPSGASLQSLAEHYVNQVRICNKDGADTILGSYIDLLTTDKVAEAANKVLVSSNKSDVTQREKILRLHNWYEELTHRPLLNELLSQPHIRQSVSLEAKDAYLRAISKLDTAKLESTIDDYLMLDGCSLSETLTENEIQTSYSRMSGEFADMLYRLHSMTGIEPNLSLKQVQDLVQHH